VIGAHGASAMGGGAVAGTAEDMRKQRFHELMQLRRESPKIQLNDKSKICCLKHSAIFLGNC
jgi:hypothetical protein